MQGFRWIWNRGELEELPGQVFRPLGLCKQVPLLSALNGTNSVHLTRLKGTAEYLAAHAIGEDSRRTNPQIALRPLRQGSAIKGREFSVAVQLLRASFLEVLLFSEAWKADVAPPFHSISQKGCDLPWFWSDVVALLNLKGLRSESRGDAITLLVALTSGSMDDGSQCSWATAMMRLVSAPRFGSEASFACKDIGALRKSAGGASSSANVTYRYVLDCRHRKKGKQACGASPVPMPAPPQRKRIAAALPMQAGPIGVRRSARCALPL
jgi:hypothetical protein